MRRRAWLISALCALGVICLVGTVACPTYTSTQPEDAAEGELGGGCNCEGSNNPADDDDDDDTTGDDDDTTGDDDVADDDTTQEPVDLDGDGYSPPEDCDDEDSNVYPGNYEVCDWELKDSNCDDEQETWAIIPQCQEWWNEDPNSEQYEFFQECDCDMWAVFVALDTNCITYPGDETIEEWVTNYDPTTGSFEDWLIAQAEAWCMVAWPNSQWYQVILGCWS